MKIEKIIGGSDRIFLRIKNEGSFVLIKDNPFSNDFISYIKIQRFLKKKNLGVPEIYYFDLNNGILIVEDLGKNSLFKNPEEKNYIKVIDFLVKMQVEGIKGFMNLKLPYKKVFDKEKLLYETEYFKNFYLMNYLKIKFKKEIKNSFDFLAEKISKLNYFFMHRDFQSKNIFIKDGKIKITDFQTAHKGPFTYDLASLIFDPYVDLDEKVIEKLLKHYYEKMRDKINLNFNDFHFYLKLTGVQRLMQALAAYVNLSFFKNKREFKKYIKVAERKIKKILKELNIKEIEPLKEIFF
ncbi:MAG: phosphotransferase [candidate division WOR-3 bacterium]